MEIIIIILRKLGWENELHRIFLVKKVMLGQLEAIVVEEVNLIREK